jgi:hypothetical protein
VLNLQRQLAIGDLQWLSDYNKRGSMNHAASFLCADCCYSLSLLIRIAVL